MALQKTKREREGIFFIKTLFKTKAEVTDTEVEYFRRHPEKIETITAPHTIHGFILLGGLVLGIATVILSKVFTILEVLKFMPPLVQQTLVDITFEIGVALIGGGVTAYFLGVLLNQQQQVAKDWKSEIYQRIASENERTQEGGL